MKEIDQLCSSLKLTVSESFQVFVVNKILLSLVISQCFDNKQYMTFQWFSGERNPQNT